MDPNYPPPNASSPPVIVQGLPPAIFTGLIGLIMLLLGIIIGYLSHPMVTAYVMPAPPTVVGTSTPAPTTAPVVTQAPASTEVSLVDTQATSVARATQMAGLMGAVLPRVRHFKGNEAAPVTLIEFGDFQ